MADDTSVHRLLAAGEAPTVDYAVISIVVITLGLVLAIEVIRHQLDVAASGNPFFQTVLELMYRECELYCVHMMCSHVTRILAVHPSLLFYLFSTHLFTYAHMFSYL